MKYIFQACIATVTLLCNTAKAGIAFDDQLYLDSGTAESQAADLRCRSPRYAEPQVTQAIMEIRLDDPQNRFDCTADDLKGKIVSISWNLGIIRISELPFYIGKIKSLAMEPDPGFIEEINIWNGTSVKLNRIFPDLYTLLDEGRLHFLTYKAKEGALQNRAAEKGVEQISRNSKLMIIDTQASPHGSGSEYFAVASPGKPPSPDMTPATLSPPEYSLAGYVQTVFNLVEREEKKELTPYFNDEELRDILPHYLHQMAIYPQDRDADPVQWLEEAVRKHQDIKVVMFGSIEMDRDTLESVISICASMEKLAVLDLAHALINTPSSKYIAALLDIESLRFIDITDTDAASRMFKKKGIWRYLTRKQRTHDIAKFIWRMCDEHTLSMATMPEECRTYCKPAHLRYAKVRKVLDAAYQYAEIHEHINGCIDGRLKSE